MRRWDDCRELGASSWVCTAKFGSCQCQAGEFCNSFPHLWSEDCNFQDAEASNNIPIWGRYLNMCEQGTTYHAYQILLGEGIELLCLFEPSSSTVPCSFAWILTRKPYCFWRWEDQSSAVDTQCVIAKATWAPRGWGSQRWVSHLGGLYVFQQQKRGDLFIEHSQNLRKLFLPRGPE